MFRYRLVESAEISPGTLLVTLGLIGGEKPMLFEPGQYAVIMPYNGARPMAARCFSMTSSPVDTDILQFSMRIRGRYTTQLSRLTPGTSIDVRGPFGSFTLAHRQARRAILLAGGIGITPFMSMIRTATRTPGHMPVVLHYSVRNQADVPFGAELVNIAQHDQNFRLQFVVGEGDVSDMKIPKVNVASGFLTDQAITAVTPDAFNDDLTMFYLCGPPSFMKAAATMLQRNGVAKERILSEAFSQGPGRQTSRAIDWPYNMYSLSAVGLSLATLAIMLQDALKSFPNATKVTAQLQPSSTSSRREADIDNIVAGLPDQTITTESAGLTAAKLAAAQAAQTAPTAAEQPVANQTATTPKPVTTTPVVSAPAPTPAPTPTPTTAPTPVCTTNQSGVTTCR